MSFWRNYWLNWRTWLPMLIVLATIPFWPAQHPHWLGLALGSIAGFIGGGWTLSRL